MFENLYVQLVSGSAGIICPEDLLCQPNPVKALPRHSIAANKFFRLSVQTTHSFDDAKPALSHKQVPGDELPAFYRKYVLAGRREIAVRSCYARVLLPRANSVNLPGQCRRSI